MSAPAATVPARRASREPAMPYPELPKPGAGRAEFWRAAWLRDLAHLQALRSFLVSSSHETWSKPLSMAMAAAEVSLEREVEQSFPRLVEAGGLLYAWIPEGGAA